MPTARPASSLPLAMLETFGPDTPADRTPSVGEALEHVHALTHARGENFPVLSALVPPDLRDDFAAVYAFCRWADDLADETGKDAEARDRSLELLSWWRRELDACFLGEPRHPVFIALARTVEARTLRPEPFHRLIDAFEQDQRVTRYNTWDDLFDYCRNSANPVGHIVLTLGGLRPPEETDATADLYAMSDAICTALQLTNFWQDVRRDLVERDRVYLPAVDSGVTPEQLAEWKDRPDDPRARVPYIRALRPLVARTRELYEIGRPLPDRLDPAIAPVVRLFGAGGTTVLRKIERAGCTTLWRRPRLTKADKAALVARAWARARVAGRRGGRGGSRGGSRGDGGPA